MLREDAQGQKAKLKWPWVSLSKPKSSGGKSGREEMKVSSDPTCTDHMQNVSRVGLLMAKPM